MLYKLDNDEHATVLAALRFYQERGQGEPSNRSDMIHEIATCGDAVISLDADAIDALCEALNTEPLDQGTALGILGERVPEGPAPFISAAREKWASDECEIDDKPCTSRAEDGCWVAAWVWVTDDMAGVESCSMCGEQLDEAGDGYDGMCAGCADEASENYISVGDSQDRVL